MTRTVLDVTRLLTRAAHPVATGVDRVELAYARRILAQAEDRVGFAAIVGLRAVPLPREDVAGFVAALDAKWSAGARNGRGSEELARRLGGTFPATARAGAPADDAARRALRLRIKALSALGRPPAQEGDVYLHVSHARLDRPEPFRRLKAAGTRLVVLVHDLIPIFFPEYGRPREDARHRRRMTTALENAGTLIANSQATARDLAAFAAETGLPLPSIVVAPLGIEDGFRADVPALAAPKPYFVILGTIEPRKNHLLALHVWRRLAARLGSVTPTLVIVGRRGWENEMVVDLLERAPGVQSHVIEVNDLPDAALLALVKGARALLFPSFAEGYGLPLAEALALRAPVLASDLGAFREIAGDRVAFLDPLDGPAWEAAVLDYAADGSPRRAAAIAKAGDFRAPSWDDHFTIVREATRLL